MNWTARITRNDPYDGRQDTVTVPFKPLDGIYTVRGRDGWCPSITRILYGRNRIRLRWTALLDGCVRMCTGVMFEVEWRKGYH
jgi:hypothetical protein